MVAKGSTSTNLVIVESPSKSVSITKYLNSNPALAKYGKFVVLASYGHIRDLSKKTLAIDIEHEFAPQYEFLTEKKDQMDKIKKAAAKADAVYLASDFDQEGEFIGESIRVFLNLGENYKRIVFTEITAPALQYAIENYRKIDKFQLEGQQCRRILDRLVGFKLSPLLWKKFTTGSVTLSAGRVQSAVMHLIIQREKEIEAFKTTPYWHFNGDFTIKVGKDVTNLEEVKLYDKNLMYKTEDPKNIDKLFKSLKNSWSVSDVKSRQTRQSPDAPFITSTLQQEASGKLKTGVKRIMAVAQELYEAGHITYMRTDSYNMSEVFKSSAKDYIIDKFGDDYYEGGVLKKKAAKGAQEAHECIRVTHVEVTELGGKMGKDQKELYKLIWQRTVGFLMKPAIFDELEIMIRDSGMAKDLNFSTTFKKVKFNGYLAVYDIKNETNNFEAYMKSLKSGSYNLSCKEVRAKNTWTSPPARYNDAALVKLMETNGIARPSTFSSIIEKLYDKTYVVKTDIQGEEKSTSDFVFDPSPPSKKLKEVKGKTMVGAEQGKAKPTDIGFEIDKYLSEHFEYIVDKSFTANMEEDLDEIAEGKKKRNQILDVFWKKLSKDLDNETQKKEEKRKIESEKKTVTVSGKEYIVRIGPYGPLIEYEKDGKKKYIGLKGYLPIAKKEYLDIDEDDVKFLLELPKKVGTVEGKDAMIVIGPYGPYIKWNNTNVKIPRFALKEFGETKSFTSEQLKGFIEYAKNKPKANSPRGQSAKTDSAKKITPKKTKVKTI